MVTASRVLITVKTDCDLSGHHISINDSLVGKEESKEEMIAFFTRYGFKTWLRELSGDPTAGATPLAKSANAPAQGGLFGDDDSVRVKRRRAKLSP